MSESPWRLALWLIAVGLLVAAAPVWKISVVLPATSLQLKQDGWWGKLGATTPAKFVARCEVKKDCRKPLNARLAKRLGYYRHLLAAGTGFVLFGIILLLPKVRALYNARFATLSDVKAFLLKKDARFAIPLARLRGRLIGLQHDPEKRVFLRHVEVVAPSQTGKSVHAKAVLASFGGSVVLVDIKGELLKDTGNYRKEVGRVFVLNPRTCVHRYNPFDDLGSDTASLRAVAALLVVDPRDRDPVFADRAIPALVAALRAAQLLGRPPLTYVDDLVANGAVNFITQLAALDDTVVRRNLINYLGTTPEEFDLGSLNDARGFISSSWNTLLGRLQPFFEPAVLQMMAASDFTAADLAEDATTVYLSWPEDLLQSNARPLQLVLHGLVTGLCRNFDRGKVPAVPTLLLLDEAAQYRIPSLPTYITTMLGRWICALLYVQDEAQLRTCYGDDAPVITANCTAKLYVAPADATAKSLSELLGHVSAKTVSRQVGKGRTVSHYKRELMTPDEITVSVGPEEAILRIDGFRTVRGKRIQWFKDPVLRRRLKRPPLHIPGVTVFE